MEMWGSNAANAVVFTEPDFDMTEVGGLRHLGVNKGRRQKRVNRVPMSFSAVSVRAFVNYYRCSSFLLRG